MKLVGEGGSITLWIPSNLAYGPEGAGRMIGANEALVFNVEIVEVKPYEEPKPAVTPSLSTSRQRRLPSRRLRPRSPSRVGRQDDFPAR